MNLNNFTIKAQEAVQRAQQAAMEGQQQAIELGHLLKGILEVDESVAPFVFKKLGANYDAIRQATDSIVQSYPYQRSKQSVLVAHHYRGVAKGEYLPQGIRRRIRSPGALVAGHHCYQ